MTTFTPEQLAEAAAQLSAQWPGGVVGLRVAPAVVPTAMNLAVVRSTKGPLIRIEFHTPLGYQAYIYDCDGAMQVGEEIRSKSSQAKSGLILPGLVE